MSGERRLRGLAVPAALLLAALFAVGLARLFQLRFGAGDVYPPYSTLRSDPLGARAFHDSLAQAGLPVVRSYRPAPEPPGAPGAGATLFLLGASPHSLRWSPRELAEALEGAAAAGARVVLCLRGGSGAVSPRPRGEAEPAGDQRGEDPEGGRLEPPGAPPQETPAEPPGEHPGKPDAPWSARARLVSLGERWGFSLEAAPLPSRPAPARRAEGIGGLPEEVIPWYSPFYLEDLGEAWRVIYAVEGRPVVAERDFGAGTLVVASDAYLMSNEALWRERQPAFLAWLAGPGSPVVFAEAHLGVVEAPGIAALARRLGLQGGLPALAALFLLVAWRRGSPLGGALPSPPALPGSEPAADSLGRDAAEGLENLLRRSIPRDQLIAACLREWERTAAPRGPAGEAARRRLREALAASAGRDPAETYRHLCRALARRPGLRPPGGLALESGAATPKQSSRGIP